jgi:hypothetical protein
MLTSNISSISRDLVRVSVESFKTTVWYLFDCFSLSWQKDASTNTDVENTNQRSKVTGIAQLLRAKNVTTEEEKEKKRGRS